MARVARLVRVRDQVTALRVLIAALRELTFLSCLLAAAVARPITLAEMMLVLQVAPVAVVLAVLRVVLGGQVLQMRVMPVALVLLVPVQVIHPVVVVAALEQLLLRLQPTRVAQVAPVLLPVSLDQQSLEAAAVAVEHGVVLLALVLMVEEPEQPARRVEHLELLILVAVAVVETRMVETLAAAVS